MNVFTTINPNSNFEVQFEALNSWSKFYKVYSVNPSDEADLIKENYPFVNVIETDDIFNYDGKKLVRLNAILNAIKSIGGICAITNSDIILKKQIKLGKLSNDLIIASRWELDDGQTYQFQNGYDLFIFDSKIADLFMNKNYVIGMPWWDYWIPLFASKLGLKIKHINNQVIFHRTHSTNYDGNIWISFGELLYNDIIIQLMRREINIDVYNFCTLVKGFIVKKQINFKV